MLSWEQWDDCLCVVWLRGSRCRIAPCGRFCWVFPASFCSTRAVSPRLRRFCALGSRDVPFLWVRDMEFHDGLPKLQRSFSTIEGASCGASGFLQLAPVPLQACRLRHSLATSRVRIAGIGDHLPSLPSPLVRPGTKISCLPPGKVGKASFGPGGEW